MADISKITASNGTTYDIKDATARDSISQLSGYGALDLDTLTENGLYYCFNASTNTPEGSGGALLVVGYITNTIQVFFKNNTSGTIHMRNRSSSSWGNWVSIH